MVNVCDTNHDIFKLIVVESKVVKEEFRNCESGVDPKTCEKFSLRGNKCVEDSEKRKIMSRSGKIIVENDIEKEKYEPRW